MTLEDLHFSREWFEDEVRDGFFVTGTMKRNWAGQLVVLKEIDRACKKLGIHWYMDSGTLLGAVRHKGFIPWDDDIDISMSRKDLELFRKKAREYLPEGYWFNDPREGEKSETTVFRVINRKNVSLEDSYLETYMGSPFIMGIDIFPYENYLDSEEAEHDRVQKINILLACACRYKEDPDIEKYKEQFDKCEETFGIDFRKEKNITNSLYLKILELFQMGTNENSKKVRICWSTDYVFERTWFGEPVMLTLEGIELPAPAEYEKVLFAEFGNKKYIVKGAGHDYPIYGRQEKKIKEELGRHVFRYTYNDKDIDLEKPESPKAKSDKILAMIDKLQNSLRANLLDEQSRAQVLINEQKLLMSLTSVLTPLFDQSVEPAASIKSFGEAIFQVFSEWKDDSLEKLDEALRNVENAVNEEFDNRFDVVFLPCRASWWHSMEKTWMYAKDLKDVNVYVCPIPWYEEPQLSVRGECHDETELFPEDVTVTPRNQYDIALKHPQAIVIQVPYDNMNRDIMIDDEFCAHRLKNFTDKLIYIPCFEPDTPGPEDGVSRKALYELIEQPAVMYADEIILPTGGMREIYIDRLVELGGEEKRAYWEKKIRAADSKELSMRDTVFH